VAILGTYSRGGFIALTAVLVVYALRTRTILLGAGIFVVFIVSITMLPQKWSDRMATIETYQSDESFQQRLAAWRTAISIGLDRPFFGAGYRSTEDPAIYEHYKSSNDVTRKRAVHNAYLQVLADHGFVGVVLFISMLLLAIYNCSYVSKLCSMDESQYWLAYLARMLQISFIGYAVGALALSVAYYDVFLLLIVLSALIKDYEKFSVTTFGELRGELAAERTSVATPLLRDGLGDGQQVN
jgi:probable O-glycosylation ligase (exosortase A-associated)